jgi:hypothetical protein
MTIDRTALHGDQQESLDDGEDYIEDFNAALSRWWEQERESCE